MQLLDEVDELVFETVSSILQTSCRPRSTWRTMGIDSPLYRPGCFGAT
jgi:hypothetical protein